MRRLLGSSISPFGYLASLIVFNLLVAVLPAGANDAPLPKAVWEGSGQTPENGLPDGEFAFYEVGGKTKIAAWYGSPTTRYQHGILGDAIEAGSLHVEYRDGRRLSLTLPSTEVFEDRTPRLADMDGDGRPEVITIRSYVKAGASVAIFGVRDEKLVELASTPAIGRPNRWLNIAGIADYAGHGTPQISYVETPHIGGTLYFVKWQGSKLIPIASMPGFSNHKIGSRNQNLSADIFYNDDSLPDLGVPSDSRRTLKIIGFANGQLEELDRFSLPNAVKSRADHQAGNQNNCLRLKLESVEVFDLCSPHAARGK
jgi:hypothetical protein